MGNFRSSFKINFNAHLLDTGGFEEEASKNQILQGWGIRKLPLKNSWPNNLIKQTRSTESWKKPLMGTFKLNFDGATKGNPDPANFDGAIRDS